MSVPEARVNPMTTPNKVGLTKKDYGGSPSTLCTGCGHDSITLHIISAFYELNIPPHKVAKLSGIGCSSKTPAYFLSGAHGFNAVHGRMPSVATGAAVANRSMVNIAVSGDGDSASIGMGQFVHIVRRNIPLLYIIENNGVYGLTKGQFSATSDLGSVQKKGDSNHFNPIDLCMLALDLGCDFVGRSFSGDAKQMVPLIESGLSHRGTAVLDVISPCITFNNHEGSTKSYKFVKDNDQAIHEIGFVPSYTPIDVDYDPGTTTVVALPDGAHITLKKIKDHDPTNRKAALDLLHAARESGHFLTGLFYVNPDTVPFHEVIKIAETPLVELSIDKIRPSNASLNEVMESLK
ncbi:MAG: thiamine pyrophosphate enzyme-like TPP-binding protein [Bacteriovoracaceae bacterium]|nr:thiamine pyrophosphate enzyme-like TPP-binding protein [Bacteriovoracaceae bacterium]